MIRPSATTKPQCDGDPPTAGVTSNSVTVAKFDRFRGNFRHEQFMPIPDFQAFMLPVLAFASDGEEHSIEEARNALSQQFALTPEERNELLPSGRQRRFDNRVAWAKSFLDKARLLETPRRAHFRITDRGRALLAENPKRIDVALLERYE
jgi:restriction system protein